MEIRTSSTQFIHGYRNFDQRCPKFFMQKKSQSKGPWWLVWGSTRSMHLFFVVTVIIIFNQDKLYIKYTFMWNFQICQNGRYMQYLIKTFILNPCCTALLGCQGWWLTFWHMFVTWQSYKTVHHYQVDIYTMRWLSSSSSWTVILYYLYVVSNLWV